MQSGSVRLHHSRVIAVCIIIPADDYLVVLHIQQHQIAPGFGDAHIAFVCLGEGLSHFHLRHCLTGVGIEKQLVDKNRLQRGGIVRHQDCQNVFGQLFAVHTLDEFLKIMLGLVDLGGIMMIKRNIGHHRRARQGEGLKIVRVPILHQNVRICNDHRDCFCHKKVPPWLLFYYNARAKSIKIKKYSEIRRQLW